MRHLFWKEWHEQSWKLGFGCIVLGALAAMAFHARLLADETTAMWICYLGLTLLPILASTGLIAAEREAGTLEMLLGLPISRWRVLAAKSWVGATLVAGPLLVAAGVSIAIADAREVPDAWLAILYLRSTAAALVLLVWMVALTAALPSEARAALIAVGVLLFWELATVGLSQPSLPHSATTISPLAFVFGFSDAFAASPSWLAVAATQLVVTAALWALTLAQFKLGDAAE